MKEPYRPEPQSTGDLQSWIWWHNRGEAVELLMEIFAACHDHEPMREILRQRHEEILRHQLGDGFEEEGRPTLELRW